MSLDAAKPFQFFAAEVSYFSAKVRPALRYKGIPYQEIAPSPEAYRDVIVPRTGVAFIPVVITPEDEVLQDSSFILDELERRIPDPALYPATPVQRVVAYLIEVYADEFGLLPAMHYRWSFPESEAKAREDFAAASGNREAGQHFADRMKGTLPALGICPESIPAIEAHTRDLLGALSHHFEAHDFLLGSRMSLADCALMGPLYAHLYLDAVPGRLLRETAPLVCAWMERMKDPEPGSGTFLPNDTLAPSLRPLLELIGRDAIPVILDTLRAFESWADRQPDDIDELPRGVSTHRTQLRGVSFDRYTSSYTLWMVQRPLAVYENLSGTARSAVDRALEGTDLAAMLRYFGSPNTRLAARL
jgi:glutathione S-transferase